MQCERTLAKGKIVQAGQLKFHPRRWEKFTSDKVNLGIVKGYKIDSISVPTQDFPPQQPKLEEHEERTLKTLLEELLQKGVIEKCFHEEGEFISPIFCVPRRMGTIA